MQNPLVNGTFSTRTGLLTAGTYFKTRAGNGNEFADIGNIQWITYLVQQVTTSLVEDGTNIEYQYSVRFGGRLFESASFSWKRGRCRKVTLETEEIDRIGSNSWRITITESITRNGNVKNIAETVSIAESISQNNDTPPISIWAQDHHRVNGIYPIWDEFFIIRNAIIYTHENSWRKK